MPKKGMIIENVRIKGLVAGGSVTGNAESTESSPIEFWFDARNVAPGDMVKARILGKRGGHWHAAFDSLESGSSHRVAPRCQHFGICGGCGLQHWQYDLQVAQKEDLVHNLLSPWSDNTSFLPALGCTEQWLFRNKMEYTAAARAFQDKPPAADAVETPTAGAIGLFVPYCGNKVLDIRQCLLQAPIGDNIRNWLGEYAAIHQLPYYHSTRHDGWLRTLLIRTTSQGQVLVMFIVAYEAPDPDRTEALHDLLVAFRESFPTVNSVWTLVNPKLNDSYADLVPVHASGATEIIEDLDGLRFAVGPQTFFQVNSRQTLVLYRRIIEMAQLSGTETVYDLYCGVGSISAFLARQAARVIGIEYVESSIIAARDNFQRNGLANGTFLAGDMKDLLVPSLFQEHGFPDLVVSDPPRAGMHPKACQILADSGTKRIIYVSCNPESLARDLGILTTRYRLVQVQAIDLMPHSHHIETLALLELR